MTVNKYWGIDVLLNADGDDVFSYLSTVNKYMISINVINTLYSSTVNKYIISVDTSVLVRYEVL
jgi:hypothetical protein